MRLCHGFAPSSMIRISCRAPGSRRCWRWPRGPGCNDWSASMCTLGEPGGVNARRKVLALVGGMVAGADSIDDMDLLRHGGMGRLFAGVRAPSTLGTFLRAFTFGHVRQLDAVAARLLTRLAAATPLLPGADELAFLDIDDTVAPDLRLRQAGRRARLHRRQGPQRADRDRVAPRCRRR